MINEQHQSPLDGTSEECCDVIMQKYCVRIIYEVSVVIYNTYNID